MHINSYKYTFIYKFLYYIYRAKRFTFPNTSEMKLEDQLYIWR